MARDFTAPSDYLQLPYDAALTFPASDWLLSGWFYIDTNAGTSVRYLLSRYGWGTTNSVNIILYDAGHANANQILVAMKDSSGTAINLRSTSKYYTTGQWHHLCVCRVSNVAYLYVDGTLYDSASAASFGVVDRNYPTSFGGKGTYGIDGALEEWAFWTGTVSERQRPALAVGYSPKFYPNNRAWCLSLLEPLRELDSDLAVTDSGTSKRKSAPIVIPAALFGVSPPALVIATCSDEPSSYTILQGPYAEPVTQTYLPNAMWDDSESVAATVRYLEAMDGTQYATVVSNNDRTLRLNWDSMSKDKFIELQEFVKAFAGDWVKVIDHRNRVWKVVFDTAGISATARGIRKIADVSRRYEYGSVSLVMTGRKISG